MLARSRRRTHAMCVSVRAKNVWRHCYSLKIEVRDPRHGIFHRMVSQGSVTYTELLARRRPWRRRHLISRNKLPKWVLSHDVAPSEELGNKSKHIYKCIYMLYVRCICICIIDSADLAANRCAYMCVCVYV